MSQRLGSSTLRNALLVWLLAVPVATAQQKTLLVHLPSVPQENANRLAAAVTALGAYLSAEVPGIELEVRMFRRQEDAQRFLARNGETVLAVLSDASFLLDTNDPGLVPSHRFVRDGKETYRRLVVVKSNRADLATLADLQGKRLGLVETTGASLASFVEKMVFEGEIQPDAWFSELALQTDDFSAAAAVLYGQIDAVLISAGNPLLADHLDRDLKAIYRSPELSLPVLSLREGALDTEALAAWSRALRDIVDGPAAETVMAELKLDAIRPIRAGSGALERAGLLQLPERAGRAMEIALPPVTASLETSLTPSPEALHFSLVVAIPDLPPAAELVHLEEGEVP